MAFTRRDDEIIRLYLSVDKKYRKHGTWLMNDETVLALRILKDSAGNYLWKESDETIFSKSVQIVDSMPSIGKGKKVIAFGDFSNYWLVQRFPLTIRTLKEKFAIRGQIGYLGCEYTVPFIQSGECCDQLFRWRWMMTFL